MKMIATKSQPSSGTEPVFAAHAIAGGSAPASPPMTMF